jgi:hypothetical protein
MVDSMMSFKKVGVRSRSGGVCARSHSGGVDEVTFRRCVRRNFQEVEVRVTVRWWGSVITFMRLAQGHIQRGRVRSHSERKC